MATTAVQKRRGYLVIGAIGFVLALCYFGAALRLPFGTLAQPGAALFPVVVSAILLVASVLTMREGWTMPAGETVGMPAGTDRARLLALAALLVAYVALLPWIGHLIASLLLCIAMIRLLAPIGWTRTLAWAIALALAIHLVFVTLLRVPLPSGAFHVG
ncbi:MAG: tripartite tricarboxylate transporter TctB family protein [Lautropia sp.]